MRQQDAPDEAPAPAAEPRVRILTIHAAKGLEAPVVFLADASHTTRPHTVYRALIDWPPQAQQPGSFLLSGRKDSLDRISSQLVEAQTQAEQRENANLLYVALTRAKQYLFISACASQQLGWYGDIAACCGVDPESVGDGVVVSRCGDLPANIPPLDIRPAPQVEAPDARLSSPLAYVQGRAEIDLAEEEAEIDTGLRLRARVIRRALHLLAAAPDARPSELLPQLVRELGVPARTTACSTGGRRRAGWCNPRRFRISSIGCDSRPPTTMFRCTTAATRASSGPRPIGSSSGRVRSP